MRLCHGTSSVHLEAILREGLKPRGQKASNWQAASNSDLVYLTQAYAMHYAGNAVDKDGGDVMLIEIDTNFLPSSTMLADEDAIMSALTIGMIEKPDFIDLDLTLPLHDVAQLIAAELENFAEVGADSTWSLSVIGNCTHKGIIPPDAITRIVIYSAEKNWWIGFHDPVIGIPNFRFHGGEFAKTQLCLLGRKEEAEPIPTMFPMTYSLSDLDAHLREMKIREWHRVDGQMTTVSATDKWFSRKPDDEVE